MDGWVFFLEAGVSQVNLYLRERTNVEVVSVCLGIGSFFFARRQDEEGPVYKPNCNTVDCGSKLNFDVDVNP